MCDWLCLGCILFNIDYFFNFTDNFNWYLYRYKRFLLNYNFFVDNYLDWYLYRYECLSIYDSRLTFDLTGLYIDWFLDDYLYFSYHLLLDLSNHLFLYHHLFYDFFKTWLSVNLCSPYVYLMPGSNFFNSPLRVYCARNCLITPYAYKNG